MPYYTDKTMDDRMKLTKGMTQEQKDAVNVVYYKALAGKYVAIFTYAMALKKNPDGDTDQVHKDCVKTFTEFFPVELRHKQMMKLVMVEAKDCVDQWISHYYCEFSLRSV
jgi:hypothetical protein